MTYFLTSSPFGVGSPYLNPANGFIEKLREELVSPCAAVFVCSDPNRYDFTDHIALDMKKALEAAGFAFSSFDILDGRNMEQTAVLVKKAGLIVLAAGMITMLLGAVLALFSVNLKRTLACSSMSQIGFILTGVAVTVLMGAVGEKEAVMTALAGTVQHMVNHSLLKLTLFMCAGVVVMNLHSLTLDEIRGWGRNKTPLKIAFALGGLGISGVPLFNGYISKTLLHEGIVEAIHVMAEAREFGLSTIDAATAGNITDILRVGEWIFLFSGGLTFAYMLKLFICIFVEKNRDEERQERYDSSAKCMNPVSTAAILGSSLFMVILGMPAALYFLINDGMTSGYQVFPAEITEFFLAHKGAVGVLLNVFNIADLIMRTVFCIFGNWMYFRFALRSIKGLRSVNAATSANVAAIGGTRPLNMLIITLIFGAIALIALYGMVIGIQFVYLMISGPTV